MAFVDPIKDRHHLQYAEQYLREHHDPVFLLIWKIGIETGLRISDILKLTYQDINYSNRKGEIIESKGTLTRQAKAKSRILKQVKEELLLHYQGKGLINEMSILYITPPQRIEALIPADWQTMVDKRIKVSVGNSKPVVRHFTLSVETLSIIKVRQQQFKHQDSDAIFARRTMLHSSRAKGMEGILTRQACWAVFSKLSDVLKERGSQARVGCHSLRKSFARHLYFATDKDIGLLMTMIGHQSEKMSLHYIGVSGDEIELAQRKLIHYLTDTT